MQAFYLITAFALAASAEKPTEKVSVKDNVISALVLGKQACEGEAKVTYSFTTPAGLPYLFPVEVKFAETIKTRKEGKTGWNPYKAPGMPFLLKGTFEMAKDKVNGVEYTVALGNETSYEVSFIPPEVAPGETENKPHQKDFNITAAFACNGAVDDKKSKIFHVVVTNSARALSLVSSAALLAAAALPLL